MRSDSIAIGRPHRAFADCLSPQMHLHLAAACCGRGHCGMSVLWRNVGLLVLLCGLVRIRHASGRSTFASARLIEGPLLAHPPTSKLPTTTAQIFTPAQTRQASNTLLYCAIVVCKNQRKSKCPNTAWHGFRQRKSMFKIQHKSRNIQTKFILERYNCALPLPPL